MKALSMTLALLLAATLTLPAVAEEAPTAEELLDAMDATLQFDTRQSKTRMVVEDGGRTRDYELRSYARGIDDAAVEYLAPRREKGTKMLKKGDNLWLFMPAAERTQKISGHMLRQGMMGSDISYEDMMEAAQFRKRYDAEVLGADTVDGRRTWKVEAKAKDRSVSYPRRVIWIDAETLIPLRQELYALSGMLLKTWTMSDLKQIEGKWTAMRMVIADQLREGSKTTLVLDEVSYGVPLKDEIFTNRWLERR